MAVVHESMVYVDEPRDLLMAIMNYEGNVWFTAESRGMSLPQMWQYSVYGELDSRSVVLIKTRRNGLQFRGSVW